MENLKSHLLGRIDFVREEDRLMIRRPWFSMQYLISFIMLVLVFLFFIPDYVRGVVESGAWFVVIIVPWFLYVIYYIIAKIVNSTFIYVDKDTIVVFHRPLPYFGNLRLTSKDIKQLYVEQKRFKGRGRRIYYELRALTEKGGSIKVLSDIDDKYQAESIEAEVEKFLGITDILVLA